MAPVFRATPRERGRCLGAPGWAGRVVPASSAILLVAVGLMAAATGGSDGPPVPSGELMVPVTTETLVEVAPGPRRAPLPAGPRVGVLPSAGPAGRVGRVVVHPGVTWGEVLAALGGDAAATGAGFVFGHVSATRPGGEEAQSPRRPPQLPAGAVTATAAGSPADDPRAATPPRH